MSIARGILKGFIGQGIDTKIAEDQRLAKFTDTVGSILLTEKIPEFVDQENLYRQRYDTLYADKGVNIAKYGMASGMLKTNEGYNKLLKLDQEGIDKINNINLDTFNYDDGYATRISNFRSKNKTANDMIKNQFGKNVLDFMLPEAPKVTEGTKIFDASQLPTFSSITLDDVNNYDSGNSRHSAEETKAIRAFDRLFYDRRLNTYNFSERDETDPAGPILKSLIDDFNIAKAQGYDGDRFSYLQDKFVSDRLAKKGITNYPTVYDTKPVKQEEQKSNVSTQNNIVTQTENLFKSGAEIKEKTSAKKINPMSIRVTDEGVVGSPMQIVQTLRNTIAQINKSKVESDEGKQQKISAATEFAKNKLKQLGFDPLDFLN